MESPLRSFCIACAKFVAGDRLGELLAVAATAPYFAIYHTAVLIHARRELHMAFVFFGLLLTSALCTSIKKAVRHPRPPATCSMLGNCHKYGMPSSHSAVMAFAATTCLLLYRHRDSQRRISSGNGNSSGGGPDGVKAATKRQCGGSSGGGGLVARLGRAVELLEVQLLVLLAAAVGYGRVYLGYHTAGQVAAGMALGSSFALFWWTLTLTVSQRWSALLLRLPLLRALHFRDTLGRADVHAQEAALFVGGSTAAQQQQHAD